MHTSLSCAFQFNTMTDIPVIYLVANLSRVSISFVIRSFKGTTWTQELVWMVANDLDYATSDAIPLTERYPFLE